MLQAQDKLKLLYLLILGDIAFILVDLAFSEDYNSLFAVVKDFGYPEVYQYVKELWIAALLFAMFVARRQIVYFAWAILFFYFLLDDSLQIHEKTGRRTVKMFEIQPISEISAQTIGSLMVSVVVGAILFFCIAVSYFFSNTEAKHVSRHLLLCVFGIVFFGVLVDTIHAALPGSIEFWSRIEDGGEMVVMSLVVAYVFNLDLKGRNHR